MTIRSVLFVLPFALTGWVSVLAVVGIFSDEAPAFLVPLPSAEFLNNLPEGAAISSMNDWTITLVSDEAGFAKHLYRAGAKLVLPSGLAGCTALRKPKRV